MRFQKDSELADWLASRTFNKESFQWDKGNAEKNQKHGVTRQEIEELFQSEFVLGGRIVEPFHPESRWLLLGQALTGRKLTLIFTVRDERIRPISCRSMRKEEMKFYEEILKR